MTSNSVDKENQKASCNGVIHLTAKGIDEERLANVNYNVSADLSSGDVIVEADTSGAYPVSEMLALIAKSDLEKPLKQRADAAQVRNDAIMAAEEARSPVDISITELPNDDFSTRSTYTPQCQRGKPFAGAPCVVVDRTITKDHGRSLIQDFMDPAYINAIDKRPQTLSLIYTHQTSGYFGANLRVHFQDDFMDYNLGQSTEVYFWVTTNDGGKTWSKIQQSTLFDLSNSQ